MFKILKERWLYYLKGYILGYIISLIYGIPNLLYLIPLKFMGVIGAVTAGTVLYYCDQGLSQVEITVRGVKYVLILLLMFLFVIGSKGVLSNFGIDITPFIGLPLD